VSATESASGTATGTATEPVRFASWVPNVSGGLVTAPYGLTGTPEQIAERIVGYKRLGVDLFLLGFLHYHEEVEYFGRRALPLVRELEAQLPDTEPESVPAHA
jgi:alkanesulfonate monooxygenase SsuD/methylene tetrahydromethanopterin reductase-like flavin-dependent oxidoreductase (luciferase family)